MNLMDDQPFEIALRSPGSWNQHAVPTCWLGITGYNFANDEPIGICGRPFAPDSPMGLCYMHRNMLRSETNLKVVEEKPSLMFYNASPTAGDLMPDLYEGGILR